MCGIVGALGPFVSRADLEPEIEHLMKRGPDSQQLIEVQPNLFFGSTRLAMVDPHPRSNQPFFDPISGDVISFNGEIYNYLELKVKLLRQGVDFQTESDTEVLLKFLQQFGLDALNEINGMYAFAYFNFTNSTLILARDELGKKPLFYFQDDSNFIWSSSLKSVAQLAKLPKPSTIEISNFLLLGYYIDPTTPYKEIRQILPGQILKISTKNSSSYSSMFQKRFLYPQKEAESLRESLKKAVETRCTGHESIAISLSGGVDSAIIAILAAELQLKCETYSAHWSDSDKSRYNTDSILAKNISKNLGFKHTQVEMIQSGNLVNELDHFLDAMEEPNSNPSGVSMMLLYRAIQRDGHRLVLTGDGADEIFSGYSRYDLVSKLPNLFNSTNKDIQKLVLSQRTKLNSKILSLLLSQLNKDSPAAWLYWHSIFTPSELSKLTSNSSTKEAVFSDFCTKFNNLTRDNVDVNSTSLLMSQDFQLWLPMESNRRLDRVSMHYSIEARSPFQDSDVVGAARKLMLDSGYRTLNKKLLRDAFPELKELGVRDDKSGFISPLGHWLRGNPGLVTETLTYLKETLNWNYRELLKYSNAPQRGNFRELVQLWSLIVFVRWCRR